MENVWFNIACQLEITNLHFVQSFLTVQESTASKFPFSVQQSSGRFFGWQSQNSLCAEPTRHQWPKGLESEASPVHTHIVRDDGDQGEWPHRQTMERPFLASL